VKARSAVLCLILLSTLAARPAFASDHCTILYRVDATLEVTDTYLGKGDTVVRGIRGSLVIEYPQDRDARVTDGKVKVLHFATFQRFQIDALVDVTTVLHHFAPSCNGVATPSWRLPTDPGFPSECAYAGNTNAVAVGHLSREHQRIEWANCKAAPSYWSKDRAAYTTGDKSRGRGCLNDLHVVGNIRCDGRLGCKWGGLARGDNPQFDVWTQPLIHGPPGSDESLQVSSDLSTIRTPKSRKDGRQSYNLPNNAPSRTWFSWTATRDDTSPFTTCP
jgi:hypothetical protein